MVTNQYDVYINGKLYTHYAVMPLKWGNLLDERLDECYLSLRYIPVEVFPPLTPVKIVLHNKVHFNENIDHQQDKTLYFVVANDNAVVEVPVGSGYYNHDLYLLETTKLAECTIVDSLTFTNDLGRNYAKNPKPISPITSNPFPEYNFYSTPPNTPSSYVSPLLSKEQFTFASIKDVYPINEIDDYNDITNFSVKFNDTEIYSISGANNVDKTYTATLSAGEYVVTYQILFMQGVSSTFLAAEAKYTFIVVDNYYPLKRWTMKDVINRILMLSKNLFAGGTPDIVLDSAQAAMFDKIYAPEMSFTQKTLRECLQDCGKIIHGEPRLTPIEGATSSPHYTLTYDLYGAMDESNMLYVPYITKTVSQAINGYCTHIDSNAQNLVNQLDYLQGGGSLTEPYEDGYRTLRTETEYVRISESNGIISTQYPIYKVERILCGYIPGNEGEGTNIDITPYLFEATEYNSQLSSYTENFPFSKAYGIYYTQGEKDIKGLFFKVENAIDTSLFSRYAIVNILRTATGNNRLTIGGDGIVDDEWEAGDYPVLAFQITYKPIYNVRVNQSKPYYPEYGRSAALIYNQQSNLMEARYYGENLKGAVARLGNVEKSYTYLLTRLYLVPKAGTLFDKDYYISAVSVEFETSYIKCTIGLSKDFNRLSEYVGVSSNKRFYEVSERQAYDRNVLYKEFIVIGDEEESNATLIGANALNAVADTFKQEGNYKPLSNVVAWGGTYDEPTEAESEQDIPVSDIQTSISANYKSVVFTFPNPNNDEITISGTVYYGINDNTSAFEFTTTGTTYTLTPGIGNNNINSVTVSGAYKLVVGPPLPCVQLPVIASAFGNAMLFSWRYEDNYSAGPQSSYKQNGNVKGYFQDSTPYCDYYGKIYHYNFDLQEKGTTPTSLNEQTDIGVSLPQANAPTESSGYYSTMEYQPYILRKDSREVLQVNAQIEFVTNRKDLIIGSALASSCGLVRGSDAELKPLLYVFPERLNKFINHVEGKIDVDLSEMTGVAVSVSGVTNDKFTLTSAAFPTDGKSWAIVTQQTEKSDTVEDETGQVSTQTVYKGGDVLLACNGDFTAGQTIGTIAFTAKHGIY